MVLEAVNWDSVSKSLYEHFKFGCCILKIKEIASL